MRRFKNFLKVRERLSQNFRYSDEDVGETTVRIFYIDSLDDVLHYSKRLKILKKFPLTYLYYRLLDVISGFTLKIQSYFFPFVKEYSTLSPSRVIRHESIHAIRGNYNVIVKPIPAEEVVVSYLDGGISSMRKTVLYVGISYLVLDSLAFSPVYAALLLFPKLLLGVITYNFSYLLFSLTLGYEALKYYLQLYEIIEPYYGEEFWEYLVFRIKPRELSVNKILKLGLEDVVKNKLERGKNFKWKLILKKIKEHRK